MPNYNLLAKTSLRHGSKIKEKYLFRKKGKLND